MAIYKFKATILKAVRRGIEIKVRDVAITHLDIQIFSGSSFS